MIKTHLKHAFNDQRGIAALLSVVFFILIASIVTVGFMRMALLEGRQSLEDSLSKAALAAAYSGVNDAKRALLYCSQFPVRPIECSNLNDTTCPGFFGNAALRTKLGLLQDSATGSIQVGDPILNERYTCTIVTEDTYTVKGSLIQGSTDQGTTLIPLKSTGAFDSVVITWQAKVPASTMTGLTYGGDPTNASYRDPDSISSYFATNENWPALLGAHLMVQRQGQNIIHNPDGTVANLDQRRWMFYPFATGSPTVGINDPTRQLIQCNATTGYKPKTENSEYVCQVTITGLDSLPGTRYLQLTGLYRDTDYVVELLQGVGATPVRFDNVNPQIDSTGAVENVFRRVQVGLRYEGKGYGGRNPISPNAIDTGSGLCKNFSVENAGFSEDCGY